MIKCSFIYNKENQKVVMAYNKSLLLGVPVRILLDERQRYYIFYCKFGFLFTISKGNGKPTIENEL